MLPAYVLLLWKQVIGVKLCVSTSTATSAISYLNASTTLVGKIEGTTSNGAQLDGNSFNKGCD